MPKTKTHSGAKKRFRFTNSKDKSQRKLKREQAMKGHLMEGKSSRRVRRLSGVTDVAKGDVRQIKRMLKV